MGKKRWRKWFAWHRVTITGDNQRHPDNNGVVDPPPPKVVWLQWIERRWVPPYAHEKGFWEYREEGA